MLLTAGLSQLEPNSVCAPMPDDLIENAGSYRLDVFTSDVADVVRSAGGWLYDHATGGWHVTVPISGAADPRPLRVLGVNVDDLALLDTERPHAHLVGVAVDQLESDPHIQQLVLDGLRHSGTEIVVWGQKLSPGLEEFGRRLSYRLSAAAAVFKHHALLAAAVGDPAAGCTEEFSVLRDDTVCTWR